MNRKEQNPPQRSAHPIGKVAVLIVWSVASCSQGGSTASRQDVAPSAVSRPAPGSGERTTPETFDARVARFLGQRRGSWRDMSVPYQDGQALHDWVVKDRHRSILEIGTSTGHSTVWLAWAARKTGGKVVTIEIDERRHREAVANLKEAGLIEYVEFHLADAHQLVKELKGPFDFVFSDADKDWYIQYFKDLDAKISPGGCIVAHNALNGFAGVDRYIRHIQAHPDYETRIARTSPSGFAISCKRQAAP